MKKNLYGQAAQRAFKLRLSEQDMRKVTPEVSAILRGCLVPREVSEYSAKLLQEQEPWMFQPLGRNGLTLPTNDDFPIESLTNEDRDCPLSFV